MTADIGGREIPEPSSGRAWAVLGWLALHPGTHLRSEVAGRRLHAGGVAIRWPEEVVGRRRQQLRAYTRRKKGREPSARQLLLCDGLVLATNVPATQLTPRELWIVYRCRWQVELLFKRAKGMAGWSFSHGRNASRVMAELLAKILGLIVLHWATLLMGPALCGISATRLMRKAAEFAKQMNKALGKTQEALIDVLASYDIRGRAVEIYVSLKPGHEASDEMARKVTRAIETEIGKIARPQNVWIVPDMPKTRSGKIMRRLLRDVAEDKALGDTTTLADPTVVDGIKTRYLADASEED